MSEHSRSGVTNHVDEQKALAFFGPRWEPAMIQHNVFFKWKPTMTPALEAVAFAAFRAMAHQIPGIVSVSIGHQNSPEGLGKGYQVGLSVVFNDSSARDAYLPHPAHVAAVLPIKPHIDDVCVLDYTF